jgi:hypothetical protein
MERFAVLPHSNILFFDCFIIYNQFVELGYITFSEMLFGFVYSVPLVSPVSILTMSYRSEVMCDVLYNF